jgi:hypothetical protein
VDALEGIAAADERLGRRFPLPAAPLPLARWVEVTAAGPGGAEVEWNLDDTRPGGPGRLALYAGTDAPERQLDTPATAIEIGAARGEHRTLALEQAQPSLRPVHELCWEAGGLHLRLTAQGPWELEQLIAIAASVEA